MAVDGTRSGKLGRMDEEGLYFTSNALQPADGLTETTGLHLDQVPSVPESRIRGSHNKQVVCKGKIEIISRVSFPDAGSSERNSEPRWTR